MAERNSATWHERQASALLSHKDSEDPGAHWDASPAVRGKFSTLSGPDVYVHHLTHLFKKQARTKARRKSGRMAPRRPGSVYGGPAANGYEGGGSSEEEDARESPAGAQRVLSMRLHSTNGRTRDLQRKRRDAPRCARDSSRTRVVTYDYTPGPGAYTPEHDRRGAKGTFGGSGISWSSGKEGSQAKDGRGTSIQGPPRWSSYVGVVPADPAHHALSNDKGMQGVHIGYMSPGPKYLPPSESPTTKQGKFFVEKRMPVVKKAEAPPVGHYNPESDRKGQPIPFSHPQKLKEGRWTFSKSARTERDDWKLGADSVGPAHYDYLQLSTIYDTHPQNKKRHSLPRDGSVFAGSMEVTPFTPSLKARGETFVEMVQRRGRALPGPGDYGDEQPKTQWDKGHTFGTGKQSESASEWNPTRSSHMAGSPNAAPQYISPQHAKSLYGAFSPGPALYSPGEANSGRIKSDKTGTVLGTANRFAVAYTGGMPEPLNSSTVRRDDEWAMPGGEGDSARSLVSGAGMRGVRVGTTGNDATWRVQQGSAFEVSGRGGSGSWRRGGALAPQDSSGDGSGAMVSMWMEEEAVGGGGGETSDYQTDYQNDEFEEEEEEEE